MTRRQARKQYDQDFAKLRAFLREWDPIGVFHLEDGSVIRCPPDEYDSYIPHILRLLHDGRGADTIAAHLESVRPGSMGLSANPSWDREIAEKIEAWQRERSAIN